MYCKNCGKEMNEYGICTNCGWRYSAVQTRQIPKRKNTLPIVYIIVVGLITILLLISNWGNGLSAETIGLEAKGGSIWYLLYGIVMYAPAYFLLQRKKLRWCALFLLVGAVIYIGTFYLTNQDYVNQFFDTLDTQTSSSDDVWGQIYNAIQSEADKDYQEEVLMQEIIADCLRAAYTAFIFATAVPSIVLSAAILFTVDKKVYTALLIVSCILALFLTSINSVMLLFMGLSIRKDYDLLLLERKQKN